MSTEKWHTLNGKSLLPRLWLRTEHENLLLAWPLITQIRASEDFLSISFMCEAGQVQLSAPESL